MSARPSSSLTWIDVVGGSLMTLLIGQGVVAVLLDLLPDPQVRSCASHTDPTLSQNPGDVRCPDLPSR